VNAPERPAARSAPERRVPTIDRRARRLADGLLRLVFDGYFRTIVSGREHIPPEGVPTIVTANHVSALDVFSAGYAVGRWAYFLAKAEATRMPLFGRFLLAAGAIPARRDGADTAALRTMLEVLKAGHLLGLAPEGTRSPDGTLAPYDPGFLWLAQRAGAVVVPAAIHGTWDLMPKGARFPKRGTIWIRFGPAVNVGGQLTRAELADLAAEVRARTLAMLADLAVESGRPNPAV
jgi:1-acyl-sn-glycerol-3-phosphate acyltransferase